MKTDKNMSYNIADVVLIEREEKTWYMMDFVIPMNVIMLKKRRRGKLISKWI